MAYAPLEGIVGIQPIGDIYVPSTTALWPVGMFITAMDPYFGFGQFVYGKAVAAQEAGSVVTSDGSYTMTDAPNSAGLGRSVFIAKANMLINTYGWYQFAGVCPVSAQASVAVGSAAGLTAAGQVGAIAAGKQINNLTVTQASTFTLTKVGTTQSGSPVIQVSNTDGLFVGLTPSGTGIAAGTISAIDAGGRYFTDTANATASGTVTVTFTYTNYIQALINSPFAQGQIT